MARKITATALESRPLCEWKAGGLEFRQRGSRIQVTRTDEFNSIPVIVAEFTTLETQEVGNYLSPGRLRAAAARWINDNVLTD